MKDLAQKLGICVICGDRVFSNERYLKAAEGHCHRTCITETAITA